MGPVEFAYRDLAVFDLASGFEDQMPRLEDFHHIAEIHRATLQRAKPLVLVPFELHAPN